MRLLVCGGRDYTDDDGCLVAAMTAVWKRERSELIIIVGYDPWDDKYQGADQIAYEFAKRYAIPVMTFPAPWARHGRAAGPKRNARMKTDAQPDAAIAAPGGRGTADMVARLAAVRVPVWEIGGSGERLERTAQVAVTGPGRG